jgi:hypothetical protein
MNFFFGRKKVRTDIPAFLSGLFYECLSTGGYIVSNGMMIDELERI